MAEAMVTSGEGWIEGIVDRVGREGDFAWTCREQLRRELKALAARPSQPDAGMVKRECPSCGGLNLSCPHGCGRDPKTGELNGTTLATPPVAQDDLVERLRVDAEWCRGRVAVTIRQIGRDADEAADRIQQLTALDGKRRDLLACALGFISDDADEVRHLRAQIAAVLHQGGERG